MAASVPAKFHFLSSKRLLTSRRCYLLAATTARANTRRDISRSNSLHSPARRETLSANWRQSKLISGFVCGTARWFAPMRYKAVSKWPRSFPVLNHRSNGHSSIVWVPSLDSHTAARTTPTAFNCLTIMTMCSLCCDRTEVVQFDCCSTVLRENMSSSSSSGQMWFHLIDLTNSIWEPAKFDLRGCQIQFENLTIWILNFQKFESDLDTTCKSDTSLTNVCLHFAFGSRIQKCQCECQWIW
jgi:hypothetical protein